MEPEKYVVNDILPFRLLFPLFAWWAVYQQRKICHLQNVFIHAQNSVGVPLLLQFCLSLPPRRDLSPSDAQQADRRKREENARCWYTHTCSSLLLRRYFVWVYQLCTSLARQHAPALPSFRPFLPTPPVFLVYDNAKKKRSFSACAQERRVVK